MNHSEIAHARLHNQQIATQKFTKPEQVVSWLGAVQAQDFPGTLWALGLRLPTTTAATVEKALAEKTIIRTWPMRGTLHFVAAQDAHWMLEHLTARVISSAAHRVKHHGLDDATFKRSRQLFEKALTGGKQLSREAMYQLLETAKISTANNRGMHIIWRLSQERLLCFAGRDGKQHTFALLDEWVTKRTSFERDAGLAELARRYFTSHGPATLQDFVWWSGLNMGDAKTGIHLAGSQLTHIKGDGGSYWISSNGGVTKPINSDTYLLPGFDEYLLGYKDRSAALDPKHAQKIAPGGNGIFRSTIVMQGRVVGTWKRIVKKGAVVLEPAFFKKAGKAEKDAFNQAAEGYHAFAGRITGSK